MKKTTTPTSWKGRLKFFKILSYIARMRIAFETIIGYPWSYWSFIFVYYFNLVHSPIHLPMFLAFPFTISQKSPKLKQEATRKRKYNLRFMLVLTVV